MKAGIARRWFFAVAGITAFLAAGLPAAAQGARAGKSVGPAFVAHRPPMERAFRFRGTKGRWWDNPRIAAALELTSTQQKAMDGILYDHREKLIDLQANLEKANLAMEPLMNADTPNQAAIEAQIDKVVAARGALEKANANFLLAIRMKLTPEQWKQIKTFRADRGMHRMHGRMGGAQHREWMGRGPHRGMPGPGDQPGPPPPPVPPTPPSTGGANSGTGTGGK